MTISIDEQRREQRMQETYDLAQTACHDFAVANVVDACARIRDTHRNAALVRFELWEGECGWCAEIVTVRDSNGKLLWHLNQQQPGDVGDDSTITDRLAVAQAWGIRFAFSAVKEEGLCPSLPLVELRLADYL